jgi:cathepsin L
MTYRLKYRRLIWQANHKFIEKHNEEANRGIHTFFLGMNKFGDLENSEFIKKYTGYKSSKKTDSIKSTNIVDRSMVKRSIDFEIPKKFDWR